MVRSFSSYLDSGLVAPSYGWGAMALCLTKHGEKHGHSNEIPKKMGEKQRNTNKDLMFLNVEPCWTIYFRNEDCHNSGVWGWNDPQNWCLLGIQWEKMQHITYIYIYIMIICIYILYDYICIYIYIYIILCLLADKMLKVTYGTGQIGQLQIRGVSTPQA